jgi:ribosomal protein S14
MISLLQTSIKEKKQRIKFKTSESERRFYKFQKIQARNLGTFPLHTLPKKRIKNFCLVSGSARSVYSRKFRLSRHQVKRYFSFIRGLRISSW